MENRNWKTKIGKQKSENRNRNQNAKMRKTEIGKEKLEKKLENRNRKTQIEIEIKTWKTEIGKLG